jgi:hypothetical protein
MGPLVAQLQRHTVAPHRNNNSVIQELIVYVVKFVPSSVTFDAGLNRGC